VANRTFQLDQTRWRNTLAGQTVVVHQHLDGRMSIRYPTPHSAAFRRSIAAAGASQTRYTTPADWQGSGITNHRKEIFL
jgi:hypothetical protein